ncbi:MAG: hypothetical protein P8O09_05730 [Flavobacteriaceae bacterium]|nr:hypothetical protein [Flavobacteriaceae bacterium]
MKKILFTLALLISFSQSIYSQKFDGFTHIAIYDIDYQSGVDVYELTPLIIDLFEKKGFETLRIDKDYNPYDGYLPNNLCQVLFLEVYHSTYVTGSMSLEFSDCNEKPFTKFSDSGIKNLSVTPKHGFRGKMKSLLKKVKKKIGRKYKFNSSRTPILQN